MECPCCCKVRKIACDLLALHYLILCMSVSKQTTDAQCTHVKHFALEELCCEQILYLAQFMVCSQQISDPIRPTELSQASIPDPSPRPHTYRSA